MTRLVLVGRLVSMYDPFWALGLTDPEARRAIGSAEPIANYLEEHLREGLGGIGYDLGRIAFFRDEFKAGRQPPPISVDCHCERGWVYAEPVVLDGHHRLAGAMLAGAKRIGIKFGGRLDLLSYLMGRRKTCPT